ncbi:PilZ domain-containing protein [Methylobacterium thuringiense]|uniref:PilZ domain-containing protein n=1 Tax=Methylobacterium thuringiense TaxID=1003091 RepID=UPI001EDF8629|nr:PilZ domain-containing protein [Methylobacterium thuringiense]
MLKIAMLDTRVKPRRPVNRAGTISVNSVTTLDCVVRDYSASGVRLEMVSTAAVPAEFVLTLDGVTAPRLCRLIWRSQQAIGASFIEGASA